MNFGHKIAVLYSAFVVFILTFVVLSFQMEFDLESDNYYEKELKFSDEIHAEEAFNALGAEIRFVNKSNLEILIPDTIAHHTDSISILLHRPSDAKMDAYYTFSSSNLLHVPYDQLHLGLYKLEVAFKMNNVAHLYKSNIYINPQ